MCSTRYVFPGPHKCFKAYTGLSFQFVQGGTPVNPIVVVSDIIQDLRSVSPGLNSVNIGDELVSIDGETFREVIFSSIHPGNKCRLNIDSFCCSLQFKSAFPMAVRISTMVNGMHYPICRLLMAREEECQQMILSSSYSRID